MTSWVDTTLHDYFKVVKAELPKAISYRPFEEHTQEPLLEGRDPLFERQEQLLERQEQTDLLTMAWHQHCAGHTLNDIPLENGWIPEQHTNIPLPAEIAPSISTQVDIVPSIPARVDIVPSIPARVDIVPSIPTRVDIAPIKPARVDIVPIKPARVDKADARIEKTYYADYRDPRVVEVKLSNGRYMWRCVHPGCTYICKRRYHARMHYKRIHENNGRAASDKREYYLYEQNGQMLCGRCPWYRRAPVACKKYSLTAVTAVSTTVHAQPAVDVTDVIQIQNTAPDVVHTQNMIPDVSFLGPCNETKDRNYRAPRRFTIRTTRGLRVPHIENGVDGVVFKFGGHAN